jgi:hypothetical protein
VTAIFGEEHEKRADDPEHLNDVIEEAQENSGEPECDIGNEEEPKLGMEIEESVSTLLCFDLAVIFINVPI